MASLLWTIIPFVATFTVAAWFPQTDEPQSTPAGPRLLARNTNPCLG
jgi:hypothetical protein